MYLQDNYTGHEDVTNNICSCTRYERDAVVCVDIAPDVAAETHPRHPTHWWSPSNAVVQGNRHQRQPQTDGRQQRRHGDAAAGATLAPSLTSDVISNICSCIKNNNFVFV